MAFNLITGYDIPTVFTATGAYRNQSSVNLLILKYPTPLEITELYNQTKTSS
jgi:hypothetical protein